MLITLADLIREIKKEVIGKRTPIPGSDIFQQASDDSKKIVNILVEKHGFFPYEALIRILNKYKKGGLSEFRRKKVMIEMDYVKQTNTKFRVERGRLGSVNRIFLREEDVGCMLEHFYQSELIEDYKERDVRKDLEKAVSQL